MTHQFRITISAIAMTAALTLSVQATAAPAALPVGTCINMGNSMEPETENAWGGKKIAADDFERIRAAGFQTVRLPVRWHVQSSDRAPYTIEPAWLDRVTEVVDAALAADLNVILNSHHFDPIYADPAGIKDWHAGVWKQIAARFFDRPEDRLWFEIENEPHDKLTNANLVATLTPSLDAIRVSNPTRAVIVGGGDWSSIDSLATLELPDDNNIHPTFHYYSPFEFTHQGASWTGDAMPPVGRQYGGEADAALLRADMAKLKAYIARTGLTPFMGESGAYEKHISLPQRVRYHTAIREAFAPSGVGMCVWGYTNTYPFWDQGSGNWLPGMLGALGLPDSSPAPVAVAEQAASKTQGPMLNPDLPAALRGVDEALAGALMNDSSRLDWDTYGDKFDVRGYADETIPGGKAALRFTVKEARESYSVGATIPLLGNIRTGDVMTIGFFARTVKAQTTDDKGRIGVRFQRNDDPYPGFGDTTIAPDGAWGWYEVTATADRDIPANLAIATLQFGAAKQTIEVGQTIVVKGVSSIVE